MRTHHLKHHQGYVNKLNAAVESLVAQKAVQTPVSFQNMMLNLYLLPDPLKSAVRNNGRKELVYMCVCVCVFGD